MTGPYRGGAVYLLLSTGTVAIRPPRAELFVYLGSTDGRISQKGTETTIGRGSVACLSSAGTPKLSTTTSKPAQARLWILGQRRKRIHMTREGCLAHTLGRVSSSSCSSELGAIYDQEGLTTSKAGDCTNLV